METFKEYMVEGKQEKWDFDYESNLIDGDSVNNEPVFGLVMSEVNRKTYLSFLKNDKQRKVVDEAAEILKSYLDAVYKESRKLQKR